MEVLAGPPENYGGENKIVPWNKQPRLVLDAVEVATLVNNVGKIARLVMAEYKIFTMICLEIIYNFDLLIVKNPLSQQRLFSVAKATLKSQMPVS